VWTGREAAALWRHVHHAERAVERALRLRRDAGGLAGEALEQAIRELLLLESSDWPFMLRRGEVVAYAEGRVRAHHQRATRLAAIATGGTPSPADAAWMAEVHARDGFLAELEGDELRDAFDPW
jgi:1,4-alpha-glucan branching enzyme